MTGWAIASAIGDTLGSSLSDSPFTSGAEVDNELLWKLEDGSQFQWEDGSNAEWESI